MIRIDAHVHMGTNWLGTNRNRLTPKGLIEIYDKYEIQYGCLSSWQVPYDFWVGNEETLKLTKEFPNRFIPLVICGPRDRQEAIDLIKKYHQEYGWRGLKIHPTANQFRVDNRWLMDPVMEACEEYDMFIQIHSLRDSFADPVMINTLAHRFPNVKIIIAHIGNSIGHAWLDAIDAVVSNKNVYVDTAACLNGNYVIPVAVEACGCEKILFGSDLPYSNFLPEFVKIECSDMQGYEVTQYEKDMILGGSMAKLLGINPNT